MRTIVVLGLEGGRVVFETRGATLSEANALRRVILEDVPVAGVEDVQVAANSTFLYDDILGGRVAELPIGLEGDAWDSVPPREVLSPKFPCRAVCPRGKRGRVEACTRGCELCSVALSGKACGVPAFESCMLRFATMGSGRFSLVARSGVFDEEREALGPRGFVIARLEPGHVVNVTGRVRLGTGREHSRFQAVCGPLTMVRAHRVRVDAEMGALLSDAAAAELLRSCPVGLLTFMPSTRALEVANPDRAVDEADRVNAAAAAAAAACGLARPPVSVVCAADVFQISAELKGQVGPRVLLREAARLWAERLGCEVCVDWPK